jgi:hypothetical protein
MCAQALTAVVSTQFLGAHASGNAGTAPRGGLLLVGFSHAAALSAVAGATFAAATAAPHTARIALGDDPASVARALGDAAAAVAHGRNTVLVAGLAPQSGVRLDSALPHDSYVGWHAAPLPAPPAPVGVPALAALVTACPARLRVALLRPRAPPLPARGTLLALVESAFEADVAVEWNRIREGGPLARLTQEFVAATVAAGVARALGPESGAALAGVLGRALGSYARPPGLCGAGKARAAALARHGADVGQALGIAPGAPPPAPQATVSEADAFPTNLARDAPSIVLVVSH